MKPLTPLKYLTYLILLTSLTALAACASPLPVEETPHTATTIPAAAAAPSPTPTATPTPTPIPATPESAKGLNYDPDALALLNPQGTPVFILTEVGWVETIPSVPDEIIAEYGEEGYVDIQIEWSDEYGVQIITGEDLDRDGERDILGRYTEENGWSIVEAVAPQIESGFDPDFQQPIIDKALEETGFASLEEMAEDCRENNPHYEQKYSYGGLDYDIRSMRWYNEYLYLGNDEVVKDGVTYYLGLYFDPGTLEIISGLNAIRDNDGWHLMHYMRDKNSDVTEEINSQAEFEGFMEKNIGKLVDVGIIFRFRSSVGLKDNPIVDDKKEELFNQGYVRYFTENPDELGPAFEYGGVHSNRINDLGEIINKISPTVDVGFYLFNVSMLESEFVDNE